jgi:hypothetical protein
VQVVPRISATVVASGFTDAALAQLAAANYRAFRRRRSLLLLNLAKQVRIIELPWVRAVARRSSVTADEAISVAQRVGALALNHFPATILPNPLVQELQHLVSAAGRDVPLVEELAADIFMGHFSDKFRRAAQMAARVLSGTLYERYYGIDFAQILSLPEPAKPDPPSTPRTVRVAESPITFDDLCRARAGRTPEDGWSIVAANGTVIEQSQILTTHNLAALVDLGVRPTCTWTELARECITHAAALLELASNQERPMATVKDGAYAWRQAAFFLSMARPPDAVNLLDELLNACNNPVIHRLISGLRNATTDSVTADAASPFVGWAVGRHWILDAIRLGVSAAPPEH